MKKKYMVLLVSILILILITACGSDKSNSGDSLEETNNEVSNTGKYNEKDAEYIIKFATSMKASELDSLNPGGVAMAEFKDYVENKTEGKVIIKLFLGGQLATTNEDRVNGLQSGAFEMENLNCGSWSEYTDAFKPLSAPYLFITPDVANAAMDGKFGSRMSQKLLEDTGIRNLGYVGLGYRELTNSKREVKTPDDVKGLKIRTMSDPYQIATWNELGATVTPTAYSELYTALQQGMVDGQENPLTNLYTSGMYEIQPYVTLTAHNYTMVTFVINNDYYEALPKEYQDVLDEAVDSAVNKAREIAEDADAQILENIKDYCEVYKPSIEEIKLFKEATKNVRNDMLRKEIGDDYYNEIMQEIEEIESKLNL